MNMLGQGAALDGPDWPRVQCPAGLPPLPASRADAKSLVFSAISSQTRSPGGRGGGGADALGTACQQGAVVRALRAVFEERIRASSLEEPWGAIPLSGL